MAECGWELEGLSTGWLFNTFLIMRLIRRKVAIIVVLAYVVFSLYAAYNVFFNKKVITRVHRVVKKGSAPAGTFTVYSLASSLKLS